MAEKEIAHVLTDDMVRQIYSYLVGKAWEDSQHFDCLQDAWRDLKDIFGVEEIEDNGHGKVIWKSEISVG